MGQKPYVSDRDYFELLSDGDLRERGLSNDAIDRLHADPYMPGQNGSRGHLGLLVANYLSRANVVKPDTRYVSAYLVSESLDIPLGTIAVLKDGERKIANEVAIGGGSDLCVQVSDLHLLLGRRNIDSMDLTDLATLYATTRDRRYREKLAERGFGLIGEKAKVMLRRLPEHIDLEELVSDGCMGLLDAIEKFDPAEGVKFETYAPRRITGAILDGLRERDVVPRLDRHRMVAMSSFADRFRENQGIAPGKEDLFAEWKRLGLPEVTFESFYDSLWLGAMQTLSLNRRTYLAEESSRSVEFGDTIGTNRDNPLRNAQFTELLEIFEKDLRAIPEDYRGMLRMLILEGATMAEVGEVTGYSESRISQLHSLYVVSGSYFRHTKAYLGGGDRVIALKL